jgi:hypothetical protein
MSQKTCPTCGRPALKDNPVNVYQRNLMRKRRTAAKAAKDKPSNIKGKIL